MTDYTPEIGERICALVAEEGLGLTEAAAKVGIPRRTLRSWLERNPDFERAYEVASRVRIDGMVDGMVALAATAAGQDSAGVQAIRIQIDTQKWIAAKLLPSRYSDKIELTGADGRDLIPATRESRLPQLVAILAVLLPERSNSDLFALAGTMLDKAGAPALPLRGDSE
jgi:alpha-beta hydrolase superfamily lysophospholipase